MLDEDKPLMLIGSTKCDPFSAWQNVNYSKLSEEETRVKVLDGLLHWRFTVQMCLKQAAAGRLFIVEHPVGAASWVTLAAAALGRVKGAKFGNFEFCMLGMQVQELMERKALLRRGPRLLRTFVASRNSSK
jgi:hypothetical protein